MVTLTNGGITLSVPEIEADWYLRAGYKRVEKPAGAKNGKKAEEETPEAETEEEKGES